MNVDITVAIIGAVLAGIISPLFVEWIRRWNKERTWAKPRKILLQKMLNNPKWKRRSLKWLTTVTGTTDEECRTLLIELGARGTIMDDKSEGWALISRLPLTMFDDKDDKNE